MSGIPENTSYIYDHHVLSFYNYGYYKYPFTKGHLTNFFMINAQNRKLTKPIIIASGLCDRYLKTNITNNNFLLSLYAEKKIQGAQHVVFTQAGQID